LEPELLEGNKMESLALLEREHRLIERMLDRALSALVPLDRAQLDACLEFFVRFVDEIHHHKEEAVLFERLREALPDVSRGPIQVMEQEHHMLRAYLRATFEALNESRAGEGIDPRAKRAITSYVAMQRAHIHKEDQVFYPLCARLLGDDRDVVIKKRMLDLQRDKLSDADYERWFEDRSAQRYNETVFVARARPLAPLDARNLTPEEGDDRRKLRRGKMGAQLLYEDATHQNLLLHDFGRGLAVQANQFLIVHEKNGLLLDPGGPKVYPQVFAEAMVHLAGGALRTIVLSHQDPDIGTSLNAWLMDTGADAYVSRLWVRFLPHFAIDKLLEDRLKPIPDAGMELDLAGSPLLLLPAHFLHSPGNFQVYDPRSKILFSGDLGASLSDAELEVADFDAHIPSMLRFHQRYMAGQKAGRVWARVVKKLDVEAIAPQHGGMFRGKKMVSRFIDWVENTPCGLDLVSDRGWDVPEWVGPVGH
jgi:hemerythrin-like domain-containing protein/glyoxylase-like metal-dependent hydrolase (beta-lactamase superfamily II)